MANREGKALNMVSVSADYAGGIQEGEATPVYLSGGGAGIVDPTTEGNLLVQGAGGAIEDAGYAADVNATGGSVVRRSANGQVFATATGGGTSAFEANSTLGFVGVRSFTTKNQGEDVSAIFSQTGVLTFLGASADANRAAQLAELFASIPTSDPLVAGQLWSNGGVVTISSG